MSSAFEALTGKLRRLLGYHPSKRAEKHRRPARSISYRPALEQLEDRTLLSGAEAPAGLVSWWRAEGNATDAPGGNHGALQNGATFAAGKVGQAFSLDGVNDYVSVPNLDLNTLTFETWMSRDRISVSNEILFMSVNNNGWGVGFNSNNTFYLTKVGVSHVSSTGAITDTTGFHHLAVTYDGATARFYIDGALNSSVSLVTTFNSGGGNYTIGSRGNGNFFDGRIDESSVYNRALNAAEIQAIYSAGIAGKSVDQPPTPDAGGPYVAYESVMLDASATFDVDEPKTGLVYQWDLDGDTNYGETGAGALRGDEVGMNPVYLSAGLPAGAVTVGLRVTDSTGQTGSDTAIVNVLDCTPAAAGLVSWWRAEGNATDAPGGNHGTLVNGTTFTPGMVGQAFRFDGVDDSISVPASASLHVGTGSGMAFDMWINPTDVSQQRPLVEWTNGLHLWMAVPQLGGGNGSLWLNLADIKGVHHVMSTATGVLVPNTYQHIAVTYDKTTGLAKVYRNGIVVAQQNLGVFTPQTGTTFTLGARPSDSFGGSGVRYSGTMDEIDVFKRALSAADVQAIYNASIAGKCVNEPPTTDAGGPYEVVAGGSVMLDASATFDVDEPKTGLVYQWDLDGDTNYGETGAGALRGDEVGTSPVFSAVGLGTGPVTVGLRVTDSTGMTGADTAVVNVFDCTPVPAGIVSWWQAEANATDTADGNHGTRQNGASFAAGKVGQAFSFDGSNDYVQIGPASNLKATTALTVEAWIYPTGAGSGGAFGGIIVNREGEYEIARFADGSIGWAIANPSNQFTGPDSGWYKTTFVAPLNQWTHVALVYDGGMVRVYGNGNLVHTANNGLGAMGDAAPSMNDFRIGGRQQVSQHFAGRIDEPSVYNRALTVSEIQAIHGASIAGKCDHADPVANPDAYSVDEDSTLTQTDGRGATTPGNTADDGVLANDTDADGDTLTAMLVDDVSHGDVTLNPDGSFSYTPGVGFVGTDSFTYKANDGSHVTVTETVVFSNNFESSTTGFTPGGTLTSLGLVSLPTDSNGLGSPNQSQWLGRLGTGIVKTPSTEERVTLTLTGLTPGEHYRAAFDLLVGASWDGFASAPWGQDLWRFEVDGVRLVDTSFANGAQGINFGAYSPQRYTDYDYASPNGADVARFTGADESFSLNQGGNYGNDYAIYRFGRGAFNPILEFTATSTSANLLFARYGTTTDTALDEYWALDDVQVSHVVTTIGGATGEGDSNITTVTITVNGTNDAPIADNDIYQVNEGGTLNPAAPGVLDGDTDADNDSLSAILVSGPANASNFTLHADGSFSYMHDGSETTSDSFTYQANDGQADSNVVTVSITVTPVNDAPVADNDGPYAVAEGGVLSIAAPGVLDGDTDADSPTLTAVLVSGPANASNFTLHADGSFSYMHDGSETTSDSFTYQANDGQADSNVVTVSITVTPVNDAPVADNDGPYAVAEGGLLSVAAPGVLDGDTDADSPTLTAVLVNGPANASSFTLHADGSFSYMHDGSETTSDSFTYQANDGQADSNVVTVSITVTPVNDAPVADNDGPYAVAEGGTLNPAAPGVLDGDTDADSPTLTAVLVSGPANASNFTLHADGSFSYMHDGSETTSDSFTYQANDGQADSNVVTVSITVTPVNDAPVADNDGPYAVAEGGVLSVAAPGVLDGDTDADSPTLTAVLVNGPANASSFTLNPDGSFSYVHDGSETTSDSFTYKANDGQADSNVVTVSITVTPVNDAPAADNDGPYAVAEGGVLSVAAPGVLDGDTDADSPTLTAVLVSGPAYASSFTLNPDGSFSYVHDGSETTSDSFTYKANDGQADSNVVTVSISVTPVNDAPVAENDGASMTEDTPSVSGNVLSNDTDVDAGTTLSVANPGTFSGTYGTLTLNANGSYSYALNRAGVQQFAQGASVTDSFSYQASDGFVASNSATLTMTVTGVNDGPVINSNGGGDLAAISIPENTIAVTTMTAVDPDTGATRTFSISGGADAARFSIDAASGALRFLAAPDYEAPTDAGADNVYEVRVQVSDGALADTQTIFVTVTDVTENQPPVYIGNGCCDPMALVVQGTEGADKIRIIPQGCGGNGSVKVLLNRREYVFAAGSFTSIVVHGKGGDDDIELSGSIDKHACLFGGAGNDRLKGGAGNDILLGGAGCDLLLGDQGRDLLIGGIGADHLIGNVGDDILVAGTTDFDANDAALCAIMGEWTRCDANYIHRIRHLEHGGGRNGAFVLNDCTVHDDGAVDRLTGSSGCDWFFANRDCGVRDVVTDAHSNEAFEEID